LLVPDDPGQPGSSGAKPIQQILAQLLFDRSGAPTAVLQFAQSAYFDGGSLWCRHFGSLPPAVPSTKDRLSGERTDTVDVFRTPSAPRGASIDGGNLGTYAASRPTSVPVFPGGLHEAPAPQNRRTVHRQDRLLHLLGDRNRHGAGVRGAFRDDVGARSDLRRSRAERPRLPDRRNGRDRPDAGRTVSFGSVRDLRGGGGRA